MAPVHRSAITLFLLAIMASSLLSAQEIYHWQDENGVQHFSQIAPAGEIAGVSTLTLADSTPPDFDPDEDRYGVEAQAERMKALREEMEKRREARRKAAPQPVVQYQQPVRYAAPLWWHRPPVYPKPPLRPQPPVIEPYPTAVLRPPGQAPKGSG